jgi:hypothetical protein
MRSSLNGSGMYMLASRSCDVDASSGSSASCRGSLAVERFANGPAVEAPLEISSGQQRATAARPAGGLVPSRSCAQL